jgi:hypothetical protein
MAALYNPTILPFYFFSFFFYSNKTRATLGRQQGRMQISGVRSLGWYTFITSKSVLLPFLFCQQLNNE